MSSVTSATDTRATNPFIRLVTLDWLNVDGARNFGILILRLFTLTLMLHGIHKATAYAGFEKFLETNVVAQVAPQLFGILVVAGQLLLGVGLAIGLGTRWCALWLAIMFGFIIFAVNIPGAIAENGSILAPSTGGIAFESSLYYFVPGLVLFFTGGGKFSVDYWLKTAFGTRR